MAAHAGLGEQLQQGSGQWEDTGQENILCCSFNPCLLRDSVLCLHSLKPDTFSWKQAPVTPLT